MSLVVRTIAAADEPSWRQRVRALIGSDPRFELVGEASDGVECLELCSEHMPDLLLLSAKLSSDESLLAEVAREFPSVQILFATGLSSETDWSAGILGNVIDAETLVRLTQGLF